MNVKQGRTAMNKNETLVKILKRTQWGDWAVIRNESSQKLMTVFIPKGKGN